MDEISWDTDPGSKRGGIGAAGLGVGDLQLKKAIPKANPISHRVFFSRKLFSFLPLKNPS